MNTHSIKLGITILFLSFFLYNGFSSRATGTTQATQDKNIVMFGNSITYQGKWTELLGRSDVVNWGIPGYTTGQLIWTIKNVLHDYPGTKIWFLEGGINDISLGVPVDRIFENQKIIIDSLKKNHIIPVVQSTILKNGDKSANKLVTKLNAKIKKYCLKNNIDFLDLNRFLSKDGELIKALTTDGCHLQPPAYDPWTAAILQVLKKYGI
jgi:lysophospholipase L1-like esterase